MATPARTFRSVATLALALALGAGRASAQAPTISPETTLRPGSHASTLGAPPGVGGGNFLSSPAGSQSVLGGRPGAAVPRVPTSITTPGIGDQTPAPPAMGLPAAAPLTAIPLYGTLELPTTEDEGPADGLTYEQAIDLAVRTNLELLARRFEINLAQADVLQASLRANPLFYADSQLIPYGNYSPERPGGQTQYDVNVSHPLDLSHKRQARTAAAVSARRVVEAQFQDAVRQMISQVGNAYITAQAARETLRYAETGLVGLDRLLAASERLSVKGERNRSDVNRIRAQRDAAEIGVLDAREALNRAKRTLGGFLNIPPEVAETIELRGSIRDNSPPPPGIAELTQTALKCRPDLVAFRLGVGFASADLKLQEANRFADAYLLYQPYTFQSNAPLHLKSPHSWALGITVPMPIYNRNQGNIERARLNITQTQIQLAAIEKHVVIEVRQAEREYATTRAYLDLIERSVLVSSRAALEDTRKLFVAGELADVTRLLAVQKEYNDSVRQYRDTAIRHRRSMLGLNTAVGSAILP
jgi:cobalt-zinc-cadmium efflux system outer membrane protein